MNPPQKASLLWIDLEMTGLEESDVLLEVAGIITNSDLLPLSHYEAVIFQPPEVLARMGSFCQALHQTSGLLKRVEEGKDSEQVEKELIQWVQKNFHPPEKIILCGNSIHNDRRFIDRLWKHFATHLHYRMVDVSSFKEILQRQGLAPFEKQKRHRAMEDILESIQELKYYLSFFHLS